MSLSIESDLLLGKSDMSKPPFDFAQGSELVELQGFSTYER